MKKQQEYRLQISKLKSQVKDLNRELSQIKDEYEEFLNDDSGFSKISYLKNKTRYKKLIKKNWRCMRKAQKKVITLNRKLMNGCKHDFIYIFSDNRTGTTELFLFCPLCGENNLLLYDCKYGLKKGVEAEVYEIQELFASVFSGDLETATSNYKTIFRSWNKSKRRQQEAYLNEYLSKYGYHIVNHEIKD